PSTRPTRSAAPRSRAAPGCREPPPARPLDMKAVAAAYADGDSAVCEIVHEAGRGLGMAIATLVSTLNVQEIVIAGGVTRLGQPLLDIARRELLTRCLEAL